MQKIQASFRPVIFPQDATLLFGTGTGGGGEATQISWKPTYAQNKDLLSPLHALAMITFYPQVNIRVTGEHFLTILGPRTRFEADFYFSNSDDIRSDPAVYTIRVFSRSTRTLISEVTDLKDKPEYLVFRWVG